METKKNETRGRPLGMVAVLATAAVVTLLWFTTVDPNGPSSKTEAGVDVDAPAAVEGEVDGIQSIAPPATELSSSQDQQSSQPRKVATPILRGRVTSSLGIPVHGGLATWASRVEVRPSSQETWWAPRESERLDAPVEGGAFQFAEALPWPTSSSYVFATHPQFVAAASLLEPGQDEVPPIVMRPAAVVRVRVVDEAAAPVQGAIVSSIGWISIDGLLLRLEREYRVDDAGTVVIAPFPNDSFLSARAGERQTGVWHGEHVALNGDVTLVVHSTFSASGSVVGAPGRSAHVGCSVLVRFLSQPDRWNQQEDAWPSVLAAIEVAEDGTWASTGVPWVGAGTYALRLQGDGAAPLEVQRTVDQPGDSVRADFEWLSGHRVEFRAVDQEGTAQEDVLVVLLRRDQPDNWVRTATRTDERGQAFFDCPDARVWLRTSGEGFARQAFGPYDIPADIIDFFRIELQPAATLRGRCVHGEEPVPDFEVTYWGDDPTGRFSKSFAGREDGRFVLDDVPPDVVHVFATTSELPASLVETVVAPSSADEETVLELPDGLLASGKVIDSSMGEPIVGATLQVYPRFRSRALDPWGPIVSTGADGGFSGLSLSPNENSVEVKADGYERMFLIEDDPTGAVVDLSIIAMHRVQDVAIQLVANRPVPFEEYTAILESRGPMAFGADGRLVFHDVAPKDMYLQVFTPEGRRIDNELDVVPGDEGPYEISVATSRTIVASLDVKDGVELPPNVWLGVAHKDRNGGVSTFYVEFDEERLARTDLPTGESLMIQAIPVSGVPLGTTWVRAAGDGIVHVSIPISGKKHYFLVLDSEGSPLNKALAIFSSPTDVTGAEVRLYTDEQGRLTLMDVLAETLQLRLTVDVEKKTRVREIRLVDSSEADPIVIVADIGSRIRADLVERGHAAAGVAVELFEPETAYSFLPGTSSLDGLVEIPHISPGEYSLRPTGAGYWPQFTTVHATPDPEPETIEVRRIGSVRFRLTRDGLPLAGAQLEVSSDEYGIEVSEWVEDGLAHIDGDALVTNLKGELLIAGLPNGPYSWTLARVDAPALTGSFIVPPHDLVVVPVGVE